MHSASILPPDLSRFYAQSAGWIDATPIFPLFLALGRCQALPGSNHEIFRDAGIAERHSDTKLLPRQTPKL
jgi:hypothetical protein